MARTIKDLDVLAPEEIVAILGGVSYTLPGDMPMELYLKLQRASGEDIEEAFVTQLLRDGIFDLFTYKIADTDEEARTKLNKTLDSLGVRTFMRLFSEIYKEDDEEEEDPTPQTRPTLTVVDGTASTTASPTTAA